jgi:hypothetical protein
MIISNGDVIKGLSRENCVVIYDFINARMSHCQACTWLIHFLLYFSYAIFENN